MISCWETDVHLGRDGHAFNFRFVFFSCSILENRTSETATDGHLDERVCYWIWQPEDENGYNDANSTLLLNCIAYQEHDISILKYLYVISRSSYVVKTSWILSIMSLSTLSCIQTFIVLGRKKSMKLERKMNDEKIFD